MKFHLLPFSKTVSTRPPTGLLLRLRRLSVSSNSALWLSRFQFGVRIFPRMRESVRVEQLIMDPGIMHRLQVRPLRGHVARDRHTGLVEVSTIERKVTVQFSRRGANAGVGSSSRKVGEELSWKVSLHSRKYTVLSTCRFLFGKRQDPLTRLAKDSFSRCGARRVGGPKGGGPKISRFFSLAEQAWRLHWGSLFSCTAARSVAMSLLELAGTRGADGHCPPSHDVERDFRHAGLDT